MKIRPALASVGAAVVLGTTGALVLPAVASAHDASTTLKFTAVTVHRVPFTKTTFGGQETDVASTGATIGFDDVYIAVTGPSSATAHAALDTKGGFLYAVATSTDGGTTFTGTVTGGTGAFHGATGTITATTVSSTKTAVTIIYS